MLLITGQEPDFNFEAPKFKKKDPHLERLTSINKLNDDHPPDSL